MTLPTKDPLPPSASGPDTPPQPPAPRQPSASPEPPRASEGEVRPGEQPVTTPTAGPGSGSAESPLRSALSVVTTIGPPLTIVTALMIYFGWARSDTQARSMGLDVSLFGFTTQDYVMRSISTLYIPLLVLSAIGLGVLALHRRVETGLSRAPVHPALRTAGRVAAVLGVGSVFLAVLIAAWNPDGAPPVILLVIPLVIAAGTAVAAYGVWLIGAATGRGATEASPRPWEAPLRSLLVGGIITLALFWGVQSYAAVVGRGYAQDIADRVELLPRATAFSTGPLGIEAPGVVEEQVRGGPGDGEEVQFRTTGLRLLAKSGDRFFLLHDGWRPGSGTVVVLPDTEDVRWQFSR